MRIRIRYFPIRPSLIVGCVITYVLIYCAYDACLWRLHLTPELIDPDFRQVRLLPIVIGAFIYGASRVMVTHPVLNRPYCRWLANSPWRPGMPLPLGPVHLIWRDGLVIIIIALLTVFMAHSSIGPPLVALLIGYVLPSLLTLVLTLQGASLLLVTLILPVTFYFWQQWWPLLGLCGAMYVIIIHGFHRSWRTFPWERNKRLLIMGRPGPAAVSLGWPFNRLNGHNPPRIYDLRVIFLVALYAGWYIFAILDSSRDPSFYNRDDVVGQVATLGCVAAVSRAVGYWGTGLPPLSLWARLVLGRPILPAYDRILLTPLAIALTAQALPRFLDSKGLYPPLIAAISTTVLIVMLLGLPPTLRNWQLTGYNRMRVSRPFKTKNSFTARSTPR